MEQVAHRVDENHARPCASSVAGQGRLRPERQIEARRRTGGQEHLGTVRKSVQRSSCRSHGADLSAARDRFQVALVHSIALLSDMRVKLAWARRRARYAPHGLAVFVSSRIPR